jgi:hypothetical protein
LDRKSIMGPITPTTWGQGNNGTFPQNIPGITKGQLKKENTDRPYLRVITITDLTDPEGHTIPGEMLTGDW